MATGDTFQEVEGKIRDALHFTSMRFVKTGFQFRNPQALLNIWKSPPDSSAKRSVNWLPANTFQGFSFFPIPDEGAITGDKRTKTKGKVDL